MSARPALKFRWTRTWNCSRSPNLAPNSNGSVPPPSSSRVAPWEGPKWSPPLVSNIVLSEAVKDHWTQKGYEEPHSIRGQTVLRLSAYVDLQPWDLTWGEEKSYSPFVSTSRPLTRIDPSMQVFQRASGSPNQVYREPHCMYVECRPVYRPSAYSLPRVIWWGIVEALADVPLAEKVQPMGKGSKGRRTQRTPPPRPLRTTFGSLVTTWASTLACTSDQFYSSWRSDLNHTPRMRTGPSLQRNGSGWVSLPLQAPSRKPSLLSKLTLVPVIRSYSATAFFTAFIFRRRDTKTVI